MIVLTVLSSSILKAQANHPSGYGVGSNGVRSDSRLLDLFEDIKNKVTTQTLSVNQIKGSPYYDESFKLAEVEYFGKILEEKNLFALQCF